MICMNLTSFYLRKESVHEVAPVGKGMMTSLVSKLLQGFQRSGKQIHRSVVTLGPNGEIVDNNIPTNKIQTIRELFEQGEYSDLVNLYLPYSYRGEIIDSDDLYLLARSMLILKKNTETLDMLKINKEIMVHHRILMFEYIVLCSREGDFEAMLEGIEHCETRFGNDSIHMKILQALILSNSEIDVYILKMEDRYKIHAPYEILRAAYATRKTELIQHYISKLSDDNRSKILQMKCYIVLQDYQSAILHLNSIKTSSLTSAQAKELVRISLQVQPSEPVEQLADVAGMSSQSLHLEIARNQFSLGIIENNFSKGVNGLEMLLQFSNPTRTQILRLIRTSNNYRDVFEKFMSIAGVNGYMLQMVGEFGIKYSFKDISLTALKRLESLMLCDFDSDAYQHNYLDAVKNSGDVEFMNRAYELLEYIPNPSSAVFQYATYFSKLSATLLSTRNQSLFIDEDSVEHLVFREIIREFTSPVPLYKPHPKLAMVVNNSLKFGGAERQVVRCLANPNFSKDLIIWNIDSNSSGNSFIDQVRELRIPIFDYSRSHNLSDIDIDPGIIELLDLIPTSPPMNPGISQKLIHLIQLICSQKPTTLHLWQDTTNVLGAIAGLICGVPRIVMSARSLPPFRLQTSSFSNKGANYYYNNRFVRLGYKDVLADKRVFLCHNSQNGLEKYTEWLGGFEKQMMVLRNGFDLTEFTISPSNHTVSGPFNIGVVFRFVEVKQPLLWLDVAKMIIEQSAIEVTFTMVGDGPLLEESIQYSKQIGIESNVIFTGYREDVINILETFDVFLLTSLIEGLPNVLIEAQAMGIPVVSTDAGGARETFVNGKSGFLVEDPTVEKLSKAVLQIINDQHFQNSSSVAAKKHVTECFSLDAMHSKLESILFEGIE